MDIRVLIIDPQRDFCVPGAPLFVKGSPDDCIRTANMIDRLGKKINKIYTTFDSHSQYQIFHPMFWTKKDGSPVTPFTPISHDDVKSGNIIPIDPNMMTWCLKYTKDLEDGGRYPLLIWPYHCLIGTHGWCMDESIMNSIHQWERDTYRMFKPITKGSNFKTEHYSAVKSEVEVPEDPTTLLNYKGLISPLEEADLVFLMGQARSHCLANTARDIMKSFSNPEYIKKLNICEDATSDVEGYENLGDAFFEDFIKAGGNITTTDKVLA